MAEGLSFFCTDLGKKKKKFYLISGLNYLHQGGLWFHLCLFYVWLVCEWDYAKTTEQISTELQWRMGLGPEWTPLTFGVDMDKGKDPGVIYEWVQVGTVGPAWRNALQEYCVPL